MLGDIYFRYGYESGECVEYAENGVENDHFHDEGETPPPVSSPKIRNSPIMVSIIYCISCTYKLLEIALYIYD